MTDRATLAAAHLADTLRRWLRARPEPPQVQAGALAYELAALIAKHAPTTHDADAVIDFWTVTMREQIRTFGVGVDHP